MKIIMKLISFLIIIVVLFWIIVFVKPDLAKTIETKIGLNWVTEKISSSRDEINNTATSVVPPSISEKYSETISWAMDIWDKFVDWVNITKGKIDEIRTTLSWAEDTYHKAREVIDETTTKVNEVKKIVDDVKSLWNIEMTWSLEK